MTDIEEFTYKVRSEPSGSLSNRINTSTLGDGYSVSAPDGINVEVQSWSITVTSSAVGCSGGEGFALKALKFLRRHASEARSFMWRTPLGELIRVEASAITPKKAGSTFGVSSTFTQVYR